MWNEAATIARLFCRALQPRPDALDIERGEIEKLETTVVTDARAGLLRAAVGFALVPADEPKLRLLHL